MHTGKLFWLPKALHVPDTGYEKCGLLWEKLQKSTPAPTSSVCKELTIVPCCLVEGRVPQNPWLSGMTESANGPVLIHQIVWMVY